MVLQRLFYAFLVPVKEFRPSKNIVQYNHRSREDKKKFVNNKKWNRKKFQHFLKNILVQRCPNETFINCQRCWYQRRSYEQWVFAGGRGGWCWHWQQCGLLYARGLGGEYIFMDEHSKEVRYPVTLCRCTGYYQCQETFTDYCSRWFVWTYFTEVDRYCGLYSRIWPARIVSKHLKKNLVMVVPPTTTAANHPFPPNVRGLGVGKCLFPGLRMTCVKNAGLKSKEEFDPMSRMPS